MRKTVIHIDPNALLHNIKRIREFASSQKVIAMVKANAYGCGLPAVIPILDGHVDGFGVACLEEALAIREIGSRSECILLEGVFSPDDYHIVAEQQFQCVIHHQQQIKWLLATPLSKKIKVWVKVDTGMHRLGFQPEAVSDVMTAIESCPWVEDELVVMTHFACADNPSDPFNLLQCARFHALKFPHKTVQQSLANSAAIIAMPEVHADIVRPGIMLYGASPFPGTTAKELGLKPVMMFKTMIIAINHYQIGERVGYAGLWTAQRPSIIGVLAVGYGDGYPRHISANTPVCVNGETVPIVGRVSMDMITIDLTDCKNRIAIGDEVELWGNAVPIEVIAQSAGTIPYELMCQITSRVYRQ